MAYVQYRLFIWEYKYCIGSETNVLLPIDFSKDIINLTGGFFSRMLEREVSRGYSTLMW